jgi:MFS family permease
MNSIKKTTGMKDKKGMLSTLWLFATLNYLYCDVVTLMDPVKHGSIQLTQGFLLGAAILVEIPIAMVLLSRILKYRANRWANIIAGIIMTAVQTLTLFVAVPTLYYVFFSAIEIACTAFIVWYAWRWSNIEGNDTGVQAMDSGSSAKTTAREAS